MSDVPELVRAETARLFGACEIVPLTHPQQRHLTFLLQANERVAVAKLYQSITVEGARGVRRAEELVAAAGVLVPRTLHQCDTAPLTIHEYVSGEHRPPRAQQEVQACVDDFTRQLAALRGFQPSWPPDRPRRLPRRAQLAHDQEHDEALRNLIQESWTQLCVLARAGEQTACHTDWRVDNFLLRADGRLVTLDWEALVTLPPAEGAGYAAISFTHSWRDDLYTPLNVEDAQAFIHELAVIRPDLLRGTDGLRLRLAATFAAAVRLAEDRARGMATASVGQITKLLVTEGACDATEARRGSE